MTSKSKNVYIDKLDDIVKNTLILIMNQLKRNLSMLKIIHTSILKKKLMIKILNLKSVII